MESADSANFFSRVRTFSLPGITTYSGSKLLSVSTPRTLLGRSLTCPIEASTVKPLPRYFWMVFALAGDSTMTKPLDNVSSTSLLSGFETSTNRQTATSYGDQSSQLSAISSQLLHQRS